MTTDAEMLKIEPRSLEELKVASRAGAAFLDGVHPGWAPRIDRLILDMSAGDHCVLGQLGGGNSLGCFSREAAALGLDLRDESAELAIVLGFTTLDYREFPILTELWKKEIAKRLGEDADVEASAAPAGH